jgi:hypothetical protein
MTSVRPDTEGRVKISKTPFCPLIVPGRRYCSESWESPGFGFLQKPGLVVRVPLLMITSSKDPGKLWNGPGSWAERLSTRAERRIRPEDR